MAYKFQLGAFTASGSLTAEGAVLAKDSVLSGSSLSIDGTAITATPAELNLLDGITRGSILVGGSGGSAELAAAASGQILVGDGTDIASVAVSGDIALAANGATTIQANAVEGSMLNSNVAGAGVSYGSNVLSINANPDSFSLSDGNGLALSSSVAGAGLNLNLGVLSVDIDELTELAAAPHATEDEFMVSDNGTEKRVSMTNVANGAFALVSGDATVASGGALTMAAAQTNITSLLATDIKIGEDDQTKIDFETADEIHFYAANAEQVFVADGIFGPQTDSDVDLGTTGARFKDAFIDSITVTDNVVIGGNLTVNGTTTQVDTTNLQVKDKNILINDGGSTAGTTGAGLDIEGDSAAVVGYMRVSSGTNAELEFKAPGSSGVLTIDMDASGEIQFDAAKKLTVGGNFNIDADIGSTAAEINLLDGSAKSTSSITIADADGFIIIDGNTTKQIPASDIKSYVAGTTNVALKADSEELAAGVNYFASASAAATATLPASPAVGTSIQVKAPESCDSVRFVRISCSAGSNHSIDGAPFIQLESPHAAVECVYVVANVWKVF